MILGWYSGFSFWRRFMVGLDGQRVGEGGAGWAWSGWRWGWERLKRVEVGFEGSGKGSWWGEGWRPGNPGRHLGVYPALLVQQPVPWESEIQRKNFHNRWTDSTIGSSLERWWQEYSSIIIHTHHYTDENKQPHSRPYMSFSNDCIVDFLQYYCWNICHVSIMQATPAPLSSKQLIL